MANGDFWSNLQGGFGRNSNALIGLGSGLLSQPNFSRGLAAAGQGWQQGAGLDYQMAEQQEAEAEAQQYENATRALLETEAPDLVPWVDAGRADEAFNEYARRKQPKEASADWAKLNDGTLFNQRTGETMAAEGMEGGIAGYIDPKDAFGFEKDLYAQYTAAPPVKQYQEVKNGYERVRTSAATDSGVGDLGVVYGFMKMLDPASVVREGEFATAENTSGVPEQVMGLYNRIISGERLTPKQRQEFVQAADQLYGDTAENLTTTNDQFSTRAQGWQVDPSRFLVQPETFSPFQSPAAVGAPRRTGTGVSWSP